MNYISSGNNTSQNYFSDILDLKHGYWRKIHKSLSDMLDYQMSVLSPVSYITYA